MQSLPIGLLTCATLPNLIPDDHLLVKALAEKGLATEPVIWDKPQRDWQGYELLIIRSCWDYHDRLQEFKLWINTLEARKIPLWNPPHILYPNLSKTYLREFNLQGIPIVPTLWLSREQTYRLKELFSELRTSAIVLKPQVSASGKNTWLIQEEEIEAWEERFQKLLTEHDLMVQVFREDILLQGEWSLIFFAGQYSHAVLKLPAQQEFRVQEDYGGKTIIKVPPPELLKQAQQIIDLIPQPWLYVRLDGLELNGQFTLMELELTEPMLFLTSHPEAADNFARSILELLS